MPSKPLSDSPMQDNSNDMPTRRKRRRVGKVKRRVSLGSQDVSLKSMLRPSHMEGSDWARMLDEVHDAYPFENRLELHRRKRVARVKSVSASTMLRRPSERERLCSENHLVARGDGQIWRQRVEDWVEQHRIAEPIHESTRDIESGILSTLQHQVNLVEALMGHGILQEHDLRILSGTQSELEPSRPEDIELHHRRVPTESGYGSLGDTCDLDLDADRGSTQTDKDWGRMEYQTMLRALDFSSSPLSVAPLDTISNEESPLSREGKPWSMGQWELFVQQVDYRLFSCRKEGEFHNHQWEM